MPDITHVVDCSAPTAEEAQAVARGELTHEGLLARRATTRPLTREEKSDLESTRSAEGVREARRERHRQAVEGARPGAAVIAKLKDGSNLTPAETQQAVRWLLLRELREVHDE